ncbi:hypothetical protein GGR54DRAFT_47358 [Hypoxylon sp. NC1633]|nr:hypothetical protein GGR54DRAFT_47358 [Hypoxylon sp. NC1633]
MNDGSTQEYRRGPRLYHKKSRTGCIRCKQRRVKCDEVRPSCGSCSRHAVPCLYPNASQVGSQAASQVSPSPRPVTFAEGSSQPATNVGTSPIDEDSKVVLSPHDSTFYPSPGSSHRAHLDDSTDIEIELPEGPWRRFWELRLLHNYHMNMVQPFPESQTPAILKLWKEDIPNLAMHMAQHYNRCGLLYTTFANSALYLWTRSTERREREELMKLQQTYQIMVSKVQRRDIDELDQRIPQNAEYLCFTSVRILTHSIGLVQTLSVDPWEPPVQWLHMGRGAGEFLFNLAKKQVDTESSPNIINIKAFVRSPPDMFDPTNLIYHDHSSADWLLEHPAGPGSIATQQDHELDDEHVKSVYDKVLSYMCSIHSAIERGEQEYAILRRIGGFAIWVPADFIRYIEERRPRAMVVLAHFMAIWLEYEHVWLIGRAGEWQIRGIHKVLPLEWCCKLDCLFARFKQPDRPTPVYH